MGPAFHCQPGYSENQLQEGAVRRPKKVPFIPQNFPDFFSVAENRRIARRGRCVGTIEGTSGAVCYARRRRTSTGRKRRPRLSYTGQRQP